MYVYKFRLLFDDIDDFVRDYEILAKQSFKDFHNCIIDSIKGLSPDELASFHICDRKWNKRREITLVDMSTENDVPNDEEILEEGEIKKEPTIIMENAILSDYMDDPHQRIIYEHDFLHIKTFYLELLKSYEAASEKQYPICTLSSGEMPQKEILITHENDLYEEENIMDIIKDEDEDEVYYDEGELDGFSSDFENPNL
ncbi:MAG: hypothetical protein PHC83_06115 [Bacteroidales bacterium]|jgi:hypothetical protein|nr:hypothetical protein [Bacteroidales bacterium]MDD4209642.1 hypothetical protein [Bacteroidales bacterium]MDY0016138.1 hypothetical protein [Bacteroidales bacterium]